MVFVHRPVMRQESLEALAPKRGGRYVDCTAGGGGHAAAILELIGPEGRLLGLDRDPDAVSHLRETLAAEYPNFILRRANFELVRPVLEELNWDKVDGMILDLGISSHQLEGSGRGFSFSRPEPLDMRMDPAEGSPASVLVNRLPEKELANLIFTLGEERASRRIARAIVYARQRQPIETSTELADIVGRALRRPGPPPRIHPATRTFQALRIAVNREIEALETIMNQAPDLLRTGGRIAVISFHSLEDRVVKQAMIRGNRPGPEGRAYLKALNKKPITPSPEETAANPRARSAKLRAAECVVDI